MNFAKRCSNLLLVVIGIMDETCYTCVWVSQQCIVLVNVIALSQFR